MQARWAPVDYVAQAVFSLSGWAKNSANVFHLMNPEPFHLRDVFHWMLESGYPMDPLPYPEWRRKARILARCTSETGLYFLLPAFDMLADDATGQLRIECTNTTNILQKIGASCPPVSSALIELYLSWLKKAGYMSGVREGSS